MYFLFFCQVEDLAQQAECPDIEVLSNVSEKEVKHQKGVHTKKENTKKEKLVCLFVYKRKTPNKKLVNLKAGKQKNQPVPMTFLSRCDWERH